jgi:hypothetical protein
MVKKYYMFDDEYSPLGGGVTYIETLGGTDAIRQITVFKGEYHASNMWSSLYGFNLADQPVEYESIGEVTEITKKEFNAIWKEYISHHVEDWIEAKSLFSIGDVVEGLIKIFFPQGVIVQLQSNFWGIADYDACLESTSIENMQTKHRISGIVSGYDDENLWILLKDPQVFDDQVEN